MDKILRLRALTKADPTNPFAWYTLAMELTKTDKEAALEIFERVRVEHPHYLATYYQYAKTLEAVAKDPLARQIYGQGLKIAQDNHDTHAAAELQAALDLLG